MQGYSAINTSVSLPHVSFPVYNNIIVEGHFLTIVRPQCLMFTGFSCFALHWIPMVFQRADIRKKYNLQGDFVSDLLTSCCCACCSLVQQDKEAEIHEKDLASKVNGVGYTKPHDMSYPA